MKITKVPFENHNDMLYKSNLQYVYFELDKYVLFIAKVLQIEEKSTA